MTETKPYNLTQEIYTRIVIKKRIKKSWWLFALMLLLSFVNLSKFGKDNMSTFMVIFGFTYPFITFIYLYFWSRSKNNNMLFEIMDMSFDNSNLHFKRTGNESKIPALNISKVVSEKEFWMLYIQQGNFIYVPKDIFYSKNDLDSFTQLLKIEE